GMAALSSVTLTNIVGRGAPFQRTTEVATKSVPVTVSVKPAPPTVALLGERALTVGVGFWMDRLVGADVPPPGVGVTTVMATRPGVAVSLAGIAAVSVVELPNVVGRLTPFHCTTEDATKLTPVTVRVNAAAPAVAVLGVRPLTVGAGFRIAKLRGAAAPPPGAGVTTVTAAVPVVARSVAGIVAVRVVAPPNTVARFTPFHCTTEDATKLAPVTVRVKPA